jgi:L-amino acid N-acyltransferase YncA
MSTPGLRARAARPADAAAIRDIYNEGIQDRVGTFETEPRSLEQILEWFDHAPVLVAVEEVGGTVVGYGVAHRYSPRDCYRGVGEFSVYVRRDRRGRGVGAVVMDALIAASREAGLWKLTSRIFPENRASRGLMARSGFREVGVHEKPGKLDGVWRDNVIVELVIQENLD